MKKLLFLIAAICLAAFVSAGLSKRADAARVVAARYHHQSEQLTGVVNELSELQSELGAQIRDRNGLVRQIGQEARADTKLLRFVSECQVSGWAGAVSPEIREALGISWNNSPEYILLTKSALNQAYYFSGADSRTGTLSPMLCELLGLSPEEKSAVEDVFQQALAANAEWIRTRITAVEPSGDIVADYRVPANPALVGSLKNEKKGLAKILGAQRSGLLERFCLGFLRSNDFGRNEQRFVVYYTPTRQPPLWFRVDYAGDSASGHVREGDFPDHYRNVFPGGWSEVAHLNGFELPENFGRDPAKKE